MVARKVRCPKCGAQMPMVPHSARTVVGGIWFERMCPTCLYRVDVFAPRRSHKED